jgi:hypothetical protein
LSSQKLSFSIVAAVRSPNPTLRMAQVRV